MKRNKKMKIQIEGYVGYCSPNVENECVELSEMEATIIYKMLLSKGIEKERMATIGFGSANLLVPWNKFTSNGEKQEPNDRVEIKVVSLD